MKALREQAKLLAGSFAPLPLYEGDYHPQDCSQDVTGTEVRVPGKPSLASGGGDRGTREAGRPIIAWRKVEL
jgi:hypothetical protein